MKYNIVVFYFLLFSLFSTPSFSSTTKEQKQRGDSLRQALLTVDDDMHRLSLLEQLGDYYYLANIQQWDDCASEMDSIATHLLKQAEDPKTKSVLQAALCKAHIFYAYDMYANLEIDDCYNAFLVADSLADVALAYKNTDIYNQLTCMKSEALQNCGYLEFIRSDFSEALDKINRARVIVKKIKNKEWEARACRKLGDVYHISGNYEKARNYYEEALKLLKNINLPQLDAVLFLGTGNQSVYLKQYEKAVEAYESGVDKFHELNDKRGMASCYYNASYSHIELHNINEAIEDAEAAAIIYDELGNYADLAMCYDLLTLAHLRDDNIESAINMAEKCMEIRKISNDHIGVELSGRILTYLYLEEAKKAGEFDNEAVYANNAIMVSRGAVSDEVLKLSKLKSFSLLQTIMVADSLNSDFRKILSEADPSLQLQEELYQSQNSKLIAQMLTKYQHDAQRNTIEMQEKRLEEINMRIWLTAILLATAVLIIAFGVLATYRQRQANAELKEKNRLISEQQDEIHEHVDKLKTLLSFKEKMTNMIIHDLKTPLNGIMNSIYIDDVEIKNEIIRYSTSEMMNLVQNLLDFYKSNETEMKIRRKPTLFSRAVEDERRNIQFILEEKSVRMECKGSRTLKLNVDQQIFRRILSNLFSNAAKYSRSESVILVRGEVINKNDFKIWVHNNGPKIPKGKADLIFMPFGQVEGGRNLGEASSTGLGLTFCKMAVEAHGGSIGITPNLEQGAEFWFTLPNCVVVD